LTVELTRLQLASAIEGGILTRREKLAVLIGYADGLTDNEIAAVLGIEPGAASEAKLSAVRKLRLAAGRAE